MADSQVKYGHFRGAVHGEGIRRAASDGQSSPIRPPRLIPAKWAPYAVESGRIDRSMGNLCLTAYKLCGHAKIALSVLPKPLHRRGSAAHRRIKCTFTHPKINIAHRWRILSTPQQRKKAARLGGHDDGFSTDVRLEFTLGQWVRALGSTQASHRADRDQRQFQLPKSPAASVRISTIYGVTFGQFPTRWRSAAE